MPNMGKTVNFPRKMKLYQTLAKLRTFKEKYELL